VEVALLKALGAAREDVLALFVAEATLLGLAGGATGFALGAVMAQIVGWSVFHTAIRIDWTPLPILLFLGLAITYVSSLAPLRVATSVAPAAALRGD
jgi:putative ABC transport system permease protein